uniref:Uncharacterized protein n=1 Tax=Anguilla anguilla TaxID=7936 RepID=A0A0E9X629_ANGAN
MSFHSLILVLADSSIFGNCMCSLVVSQFRFSSLCDPLLPQVPGLRLSPPHMTKLAI